MNILEARRRTLGKGVYKKTVEGNPAIAQGSLARRYPGITMQGWTEQAQYEGTNLFDKSGIVLSGTTITYTPVNVGDGDFTLSTDYIASGRNDIFFLPGNVNTGASSLSNGVEHGTSRTVTSENGYVTVALRLSLDGTTSPLDYQIMLNEGATALPYEPYTGGQPSPSPDYPQEITSAGNYDEGTGKYQYEVKLTGANLFDYTDMLKEDGYVHSNSQKSGAISIKPFHVEQGKQYLLITKGSTVVTTDYSSIYFGQDDLEYIPSGTPIKVLGTGIGYSAFQDDKEKRILLTASRTCEITKCMVHGAGLSERYQVEEFGLLEYTGDINIPYEPYRTPQTVILTSDRQLTKWDKLEKRNGQWGWVYKSGSYAMTGEEHFSSSGDTYHGEITSEAWCLVDDMFAKVWIPSDAPGGYCEKLYWSQASWEKDGLVAFTYNMSQIHIRLKNSDIGVTAEDTLPDVASKIKAYVGQQYEEGNPFVFWYETAEETFVPLSESEQEALNALHTFRPTTVLSNDCECEMSLTYKTKKSLEVTT